MEHQNNQIRQVAGWLRESKRTIVFSGAGMSTESGIPDFRSANGLWTKTDPMQVASSEAMHHQYALFHEFYSLRLKNLQQCHPHGGHAILADWESRDLVHGIATQNVDGFHRQAGSQQVFELHGSLEKIRCIRLGHPAGVEAFLDQQPCDKCGSPLRPGVVLFGESLPMEAWNHAFQEIQRSELLLIVGTSLQVSPVNQLPMLAGGRVVLINREPVAGHFHFDAALYGTAGDILKQLNHEIGGVNP